MAQRKDNRPFQRLQKQLDFEMAIVQAYASGKFLTKQIAETYGITTRSVQRIVNKHRSGRTQAEGARTAGPLMPKHRLRNPIYPNKVGKAKFNSLDYLREIVIALLHEMGRDFTRCEECGKHLAENQFELHHTKYEGATIYDLEIVCKQCNLLPSNQYLD